MNCCNEIYVDFVLRIFKLNKLVIETLSRKSIETSVSDLAKKVAGHQGLQLQKVVGPDEKL